MVAFAFGLNNPFPYPVIMLFSAAQITAFSAFKLLAYVSSLFFSVSERVFTDPSFAVSVTAVLLFKQIGALSAEESVKLSKISVTSVAPFFTVTLPSLHVPEREYMPLWLMVSAVPSVL